MDRTGETGANPPVQDERECHAFATKGGGNRSAKSGKQREGRAEGRVTAFPSSEKKKETIRSHQNRATGGERRSDVPRMDVFLCCWEAKVSFSISTGILIFFCDYNASFSGGECVSLFRWEENGNSNRNLRRDFSPLLPQSFRLLFGTLELECMCTWKIEMETETSGTHGEKERKKKHHPTKKKEKHKTKKIENGNRDHKKRKEGKEKEKREEKRRKIDKNRF
uniref:Uncharacterized protein n=1 Tax=Palpitomonas bilix TaxID=652834 RepID=A0A7S3GJG5_9EUKA|mmetsp:Transcript_6059/g.14746  ORF Transcript_6059/g.14746 Transcript_6059/m.14746 type:complete len:223 (+) Transcript_6059:269-937(+)